MMARRIRIIYKIREPTFDEQLEARARRIAKKTGHESSQSPTTSALERELSLTLNHLDQVRDVHKELRRSLLRAECYTDNELHDMEMRTPKYSPYRFPEREKFQRTLFKIESERRRLSMIESESLRDLHDRLLELLNKREFVGGGDGF